MKKHLLIFFLMAFSVFCFAAESENISVPNKAIGFSYTSGTEEFMNMGITYQQWFDNSLGFCGTIGGAFQKDSEIAITTLFDLQKKFLTNYFQKSDITTVLFGWVSGGYIYNKIDRSDPEEEDFIDYAYAAGLGIGFDTIISNHISVPIKVGFMSSYGKSFLVDFTFGAGFCYRF